MTFDVSEAMSAVRGGRHASAVLDELFRALAPNEAQAASIRRALHTEIRAAGMPEWLRQRFLASWDDRADAIVLAMMHDATTYLRVNTLATTREALLGALRAHEPSLCHGMPDALTVARPFGLFRTDAFQQGWFEQQDLASQRVSAALDVQPGMRVVDACAGAGGKTLHIASLMQGRGKIIALDVSHLKLQALRNRASRAGVDIVETRLVESTKTVKRLSQAADRVLIDAPCSGTGVLRRNPDIMMHLLERQLAKLLELQADILRRCAYMARVQGLVVYATCSMLKEEGEEQVRLFIQQNQAFTLVSEWRTMPDEVDEDGFYVAIMQRIS